METKRTNVRYSKEFKSDAVKLVLEQGYSVPQAAKSLGITDKILYHWKQKHQDELSGAALNEDEKAELKSLRKEVKDLRLEKEILKKASAYFAQEMK